ncbi:unnamed protein product [Owenia fusiformis]|nr:unnamed protein product [Owenia fusiformis]
MQHQDSPVPTQASNGSMTSLIPPPRSVSASQVLPTNNAEPDMSISQLYSLLKGGQDNIKESIISIRKEMSEQVDSLRREFEHKIDDSHKEIQAEVTAFHENFKSRITNIETTMAAQDNEFHSFIIKNIEESTVESDLDQVNNMISNGLGLKDSSMKVVKTSRKPKRTGAKYPGIIVAQVKNKDSKSQILSKKRALKQNDLYKNVYIEDFISPDLKKVNDNLHTVLKAVGKENNFIMRNGRFLQRNNNPQRLNTNTQ